MLFTSCDKIRCRRAVTFDAIYTLGFRGEALSSIGAVAEVELLQSDTRMKQAYV